VPQGQPIRQMRPQLSRVFPSTDPSSARLPGRREHGVKMAGSLTEGHGSTRIAGVICGRLGLHHIPFSPSRRLHIGMRHCLQRPRESPFPMWLHKSLGAGLTPPVTRALSPQCGAATPLAAPHWPLFRGLLKGGAMMSECASGVRGSNHWWPGTWTLPTPPRAQTTNWACALFRAVAQLERFCD
jgi:hypothetical protein